MNVTYLSKVLFFGFSPVVFAFLSILITLHSFGYLYLPFEVAKMQSRDPLLLWHVHPVKSIQIKLHRIKNENPEIVILGNSRAGQIRCAMFAPYSCYNFGYSAWTLDRMEVLVQEILKISSPRIILLNADYFTFGPGNDRFWHDLETRGYVMDPPFLGLVAAGAQSFFGQIQAHPFSISELINQGYLNEFQLLEQPGLLANQQAIRFDGSIMYTKGDMLRAPHERTEASHILRQTPPGTGNAIDPASWAKLKQISLLAKSSGAALLAIQWPIHPNGLRALDSKLDSIDSKGRVYSAADKGVWRDYGEGGAAKEEFGRLGIDFLDLSRQGDDFSGQCFLDTAHPMEYSILSAFIVALNSREMGKYFQAINIDRLAALRDRAQKNKSCFIY